MREGDREGESAEGEGAMLVRYITLLQECLHVHIIKLKKGREKGRKRGRNKENVLPVAMVQVYVLEAISLKVGTLCHCLVVQVVQLI